MSWGRWFDMNSLMIRQHGCRVSLAFTTSLLVSSCLAPGAGAVDPCGMRVLAVREARPGDAPFEDANAALRDAADPNLAPGPGSSRAVVRIDSLRHPQIWIEDVRGTRRHLLRGSRPRWSPDGRRIACQVWRSVERPWMLAIVEVSSGRVVEPPLGCLAMNFEWSPDARSIAISGVLYGRRVNVLSVLEVATAKARTLDTLAVFADYEFGWSPDSRLLAVSRATQADDDEEVLESGLWLFDLAGRKCPLTEARSAVDRDPKWVDGRRILFQRRALVGGRPETETSMVLEIGSPSK